MEAHVKPKQPAADLFVNLLTRLAPSPPKVKTTRQNQFFDVAIDLTPRCQVALLYLQRIVTLELQERMNTIPALSPPKSPAYDELLTLSVMLPPRETQEAGLPFPRLVLTHKQFSLLCNYVDQQMIYIALEEKSKLWDVHAFTLKMVFPELAKALHIHTKLLSWNELCHYKSAS